MFKPMLAARARTYADFQFPCAVTPKIDGIRAVAMDGCAVSRSYKLLPNYHIQELFKQLPHGLDGELVCSGGFNSTQSGVMSYGGRPDIRYLVFDWVGGGEYLDRVAHVIEAVENIPWCEALVPVVCYSLDDLHRYEESCLTSGFEGIMARDPEGPYKIGRSTRTEAYLLKWKPVQDSEAIITSFDEQMTSLCNPIVRDFWGRAKRPGDKELNGTLGSLICWDARRGEEVRIGTGFSDELRAEIWGNRVSYIGRTVTYTFQEEPGKKPRFPRFKCFREGGA